MTTSISNTARRRRLTLDGGDDTPNYGGDLRSVDTLSGPVPTVAPNPEGSEDRGGQDVVDARPTPAPAVASPATDGSGSGGDGLKVRKSGGRPQPALPIDKLHKMIGFTARQLLDMQNMRISANHRLLHLTDMPDSVQDQAKRAAEGLEKLEKEVASDLRRLAKLHPMADWIEEQRGVALPSFGVLLGITGDLGKFATVSKLWKYLGLAVMPDGTRQRRKAGETMSHTNCTFEHLAKCPPDCKTNHHPNCVPGGLGNAFSPRGQAFASVMGANFVRVKSGTYRDYYDVKKAFYKQEREDWTPKHCDVAARRYTVKCFLRDLWVEWHQRMAAMEVEAA